jgi:hypothetical protein
MVPGSDAAIRVGAIAGRATAPAQFAIDAQCPGDHGCRQSFPPDDASHGGGLWDSCPDVGERVDAPAAGPTGVISWLDALA